MPAWYSRICTYNCQYPIPPLGESSVDFESNWGCFVPLRCLAWYRNLSFDYYDTRRHTAAVLDSEIVKINYIPYREDIIFYTIFRFLIATHKDQCGFQNKCIYEYMPNEE